MPWRRKSRRLLPLLNRVPILSPMIMPGTFLPKGRHENRWKPQRSHRR